MRTNTSRLIKFIETETSNHILWADYCINMQWHSHTNTTQAHTHTQTYTQIHTLAYVNRAHIHTQTNIMRIYSLQLARVSFKFVRGKIKIKIIDTLEAPDTKNY